MKAPTLLAAACASLVSATGVLMLARELAPLPSLPTRATAAPHAFPSRASTSAPGCWVITAKERRIRARWQAQCVSPVTAFPHTRTLEPGDALYLPQPAELAVNLLQFQEEVMKPELAEGFDGGALLWLPAGPRYGYSLAAGRNAGSVTIHVAVWGAPPAQVRLAGGAVFQSAVRRVLRTEPHRDEPAEGSAVLEASTLNSTESIEIGAQPPVVTVDVAGERGAAQVAREIIDPPGKTHPLQGIGSVTE